MMTDKWIMEDWMREVWESCGLEPLSKQCGVESDYSISTVSYKSRIIPILKQLRTAGLLLTLGERRDIDGAMDVYDRDMTNMSDELARLRAERQASDEALQRESVAVADANREIGRLRVENERLRNGLRNILGVIEATKVALGGDNDRD